MPAYTPADACSILPSQECYIGTTNLRESKNQEYLVLSDV